ncbi:MAG: bifunctional 2-polyprenyl-6-hydroxyphenol methylase/3-demethylubiquinol 3-O-methyltransferase UbiG, partial [Kangiellaceae bacterium]|nr:bifunctional 2-polyprenyl-6-hydroxyphenol methylase/3-demethylubiquinol 3-O-methyltransferase UbiG [Kangiellaceae bacterium]
MSATQNVDNAEIKKFADLASRWWDKESEFKPLHEINPLRLSYIEKHGGGLASKKIIDVGCGGGILSDSMADRGAVVTGIDMGEAPLSVAKLHQLESGQKVDYLKSTVEAMAEKHAGEFDIVTCMEMMEHVPDPSSVVAACAKLVKPGGSVFFSTINRNPKAYLFAIVGAEYILNMLPKGTHQYDKFIKPSELAHWTRAANLELRDMIGLHYNPLTQIYKLDKGVDVNY